ncbi:BTB/POZ-like [Macleaya cordata]|uniref:BTB/POZ-like n=1 Tax=Macleaya cordata TaxID=56857 RepID=A0A200QFV7_MACCD|nr:BTB/POZ-like [Macleaya cordata]
MLKFNRIFSQEIPIDVTVHVGGASFALHKFPLVSKCGYIKKLVSKAGDPGLSVIEIPDIPGGSETFELAAKFCYGINFEISIDNIAMLLCAAEYLEMTEDYSVGNLVNRTEAYLKEVALKSLSGAVSVLHQSEKLLPMAEKVKLVSRCIDAIAFLAIQESHYCSPSGMEKIHKNVSSSLGSHTKPTLDWWAEDLTVLSIDVFQRVIMAMIAIGFKQHALGPVLMLYAKNSLQGLNLMQEIFGKGRKKIEPKHEKRILLETIVSLLPREKNVMPVSFLSMLLKAAIYLETMVTFRLDLEKRIALQLDQAVLDDLLIPSYSATGDTLFDVETVKQIMKNYLVYLQGNPPCSNANNNSVSPSLSDMDRVGRLMESYLTEISSDRNLTVSKFISLAELISKQARTTEDGMYRSIDIFLKAHPTLTDIEKKKICSLMDCQKLSIEASAHAAQNNRLPVQTVVQVLYHEQQRLRDAVNDNLVSVESPPLPHKVNVYSMDLHPPPTEFLSLQRENEDLKIELVSMRMRLKEVEKSAGSTPPSSIPTPANKLQLPRKSIIHSLSKKLGWLSPFMRSEGVKAPDDKGRMKARKERRHSIS